MNQNPSMPSPPPGGSFKFPEQPQKQRVTRPEENLVALSKEWSKILNDIRPRSEKKPKEFQDEHILIEKVSKVSDKAFKAIVLSSILVLRDRLVMEIGDWKQRLEDLKKVENKTGDTSAEQKQDKINL